MKRRDKGLATLVVLILLIVLGALSSQAEEGSEVRLLYEIVREIAATLGVGTPPPAGAPSPDWYTIAFTTPTCPPEEERHGGLDERIAADLAAAQTRVDVAAYDLDAPAIVDALIGLEKRGVAVHIVTDTDNEDLPSIRRLRRNGISVVTDDRTGLMHNKFIIIDDHILWTGSMNLTTNGVYCNNNNFVRFENVAPLIENYRTEMEEMYTERLFGPTSPVNTPHPTFTYAGVAMQNIFVPEESAALAIARAVAGAQDEILIMAFSFTSEPIGEAVLGRAASGVRVRGVFETTGSETEFSYYTKLKEAGYPSVQVRQDANPRIMHHKVIVIDRRTVIFGSYNFSDNADRRNDENVLIVHDPTFAAPFVAEFERLWNE
ncbi:hypothetical protein ARMA_0393 [Ardenticatena maritima]|uniref:phospholipase D n=1 Tax=Ardenticatena maritima TaxID=872965 RepID=A0A0M9UBP5_9CHLR|nr:phospholipase D-like domain-containing protein [Ardenticatena maritima]KPL87774.1 hypothetical protein SE16_09350 [Ardenticatena maritima]GAP61970.1 hypothetical protein ARMA_0393 [Ardenticatena maritima]